MSLWRKRGTGDTNRDTIAPNVHHSEQKPDHLVNILNKLHNENVRLGLYEGVYDLSIKSEDLSIKREKAMREVQRLGQEIEQSKGIEMRQALEMALEALEKTDKIRGFPNNKKAITAIKEALAQPERDYERGFIDGMQKQMQSSVDKAVNAMSQRTWVGLTIEDEYVRNYLWERGLVAVDENPNLRDEKSVWVGLTDEERNDCLVSADPCEALAEPEALQLMEDVESKLKDKNK